MQLAWAGAMVQNVRNKLLGSFNCVTPLKLDLSPSLHGRQILLMYVFCRRERGFVQPLLLICIMCLSLLYIGLWSKGDYVQPSSASSIGKCRVILLLSLHETLTDCGFAADLKMIGFFSSGFFFGIGNKIPRHVSHQ